MPPCARRGALLALLALLGCGEVVPLDGDAGRGAPPPGDTGPDARRDDATLASLIVSAPIPLTPEFQPDTAAYTMNVSLLVQEVTITAIPAHPASALAVDGVALPPGQPSEPIVLGLGTNQTRIHVTAPAGTVQEYTITIERAADIAQFAYAKASSPGEDDRFGARVALWGNTLAVGTPREDSAETGVHGPRDGKQGDNSAADSGAVYVFRRTGEGWVQEAYIKASNAEAGDNFGAALALWGNTLAVSADREASGATGVHSGQGGAQNDNSAPGSGAVYVFRRTGNQWAQEAYIKASNTDAGDDFGESIALWGNTLVVGAEDESSRETGVHGPGDGNQADNGAASSGAVYVFRRTGNQWAQEAYIKASNTDAGDSFGAALAISGNLLAVGAPREDSAETGVHGPRDGNQSDNSAADSGAVYVFRRTGNQWAQEAYIKASNTGARDNFGAALAISGNLLAVGAPREDSAETGVHGPRDGDQADNGASNSGAVYVFRRTGNQWAQEAYIKASNSEAGDELGTTVALWRDLLAVGAPREDSAAAGVYQGAAGDAQQNNGASDSGAVYLFRRVGQTWRQEAYIKASNPEAEDALGDGGAMALWGDSLAVGAPREDSSATGVHDTRNGSQIGNPTGSPSDNGTRDSGAVYIFH